jgi:hypothetical protein
LMNGDVISWSNPAPAAPSSTRFDLRRDENIKYICPTYCYPDR